MRERERRGEKGGVGDCLCPYRHFADAIKICSSVLIERETGRKRPTDGGTLRPTGNSKI